MTATNNPIELLVKISADTAGSKTDLNTQLRTLSKQLEGLNVGIKIDGSALSSATSGADKLKLKMDEITLSSQKAERSQRELERASSAAATLAASDWSKAGRKMLSSIKETEQEFKGKDFTIKANYDVKSGTKVLKDFQVDVKRTEDTIERITYKMRDMGGTIGFEPESIQRISKEMFNISKSTNSAHTELNKLQSTGKITTEQFKQLSQQAQKFANPSDVSLYNQKLNEFLQATKLATQAKKADESEEKKLQSTRQRTLDQLERLSQAGRLPQTQTTAFADTAKLATSVTEMDRLRQSIALTSQEYGRASQESNKQATAMTSLNHRIQDLVISQRLSGAEAMKWTSSYNSSTPSARIKEINRELSVHLNEQTQINNRIKEQVALQDRIRRLINDISSAQGRNPKAFGNNAEVTQMLTTLQRIDPASKSAATAVKGVSDGFSKLKAESISVSRESIGVLSSFKIAMEKFPIWMAASTAFYGTVRTAREFMSIIIDIDTKMTSLRKVMADDTDFEGVFDRATQSAEKFGQSISEVMNSYVEFAKQGYKGEELGLLADSAIIASNVGDITAQKASEYMTSALVQWKLDAKDSMGIIDSWNNISNQYATTTEKLAQGQARAGATARAMGMDMHQLNSVIGAVTAATKQSGNEVGNFVKNVLPRLTGAPAQKALDSLNISLTDKDGNLRDIIQVYTDVANKVKDISDAERISVVEGLAGKFHISRMQALLDDLGSVDSMYRSMEETSRNSAGSAMEENQEYMKSIQARLGLARVEVEKLALAIGDAFLTEGMIQGIKLFGDMLGSVSKLVDAFGALPVVMGTTVGILALMSTRFRGLMVSIATLVSSLSATSSATNTADASNRRFTTSIHTVTMAQRVASQETVRATLAQRNNIISTNAGTVANRTFSVSASTMANAQRANGQAAVSAAATQRAATVATQAGTVATRGMSIALKGLLATTGVGLIFVGLGIAVEFFMSKAAKSREAMEDLRIENNTLMQSFVGNEKEIDSLILRYEELEKKLLSNKKALSTDELKEYTDVQNKLAELLPSISRGENTLGNSIIFGTDAIKGKVAALKEQLATEKELQELADRDKAEETLKNAEQSLKDFTAQIKKSKNNINHMFVDEVSVDNISDAYKELHLLIEAIAEAEGKGQNVDHYKKEVNNLKGYIEDWREAEIQVENANSVIQSSIMKSIESTIGLSKAMSDSGKSMAKDVVNLIGIFESDTEKVKTFFDAFESDVNIGDGLSKDLSALGDSLEVLRKKQVDGLSTEELKEYSVEASNAYNTVRESLIKMLEDSDIAEGSDPFIKIMTELDRAKPSIDLFSMSLDELQKTMGMTPEEALAFVKGVAEMDSMMEETGEATDELAEKMKALTSSISFINKVLEDYQESNKLSTSTMMELIEKYPELIAYIDDEAEMIKQLEIIRNNDIATARKQLADKLSTSSEFYEKNLTLIQQFVSEQFKFYQGDLTDWKNLADAKLSVEQELITTLAKQWGVYYDKASQAFASSDMANPKQKQLNHSFYVPEDLKEVFSANAELVKFRDTWNNFTLDKVTLNFDKIGTSLDKATKSQDKASKSAKKSTEESIYITDKYKQALERLNFEIARQQNLQSQYPSHSKKHQDALKEEMRLQQEHLKLTQAEADALSKQIKSGSIAQTGSTKGKFDSSPQAIDSAKSGLLALQKQIIDQKSLIDSLDMKLINSQLDEFNNRRETYQRVLDSEAVKMDTLDKSSQRYVATLERNATFLKNKQSVNQEELEFLEKLRKSGNLSAVAMDENAISIDNLKVAMMSLNLVIQQTNADMIESILSGFDEKLDDLDYAVQRSSVVTSLLEEGTAAYAKEIEFQIDKLQESKKEIKAQTDALKELLRTKDLSIEKTKEYKEKLEDLSLALLDVDVQTKRLKDSTNSFIADSLSKMKDEYINGLKKQSEAIVKSIEGVIKATEDQYDSLIEKQKARLEAMDEEIEKEDRLKALREIDDEISKTKNDKRFSYITAEGEEILTYNKERVSELEKQRTEMLQQYERQDIKKSIQDEITRLEKARTDKIEILKKEIEDTKAHYDQRIATEEAKWNGLIESAKNGTLAFDTLMNEFYGASLINLQSYVSDSLSQIQAIKDAYASLASLEVSVPSPSGGSSSSSSSSSSSGSSNPLGMSDADYDRYIWNKDRYVNNTNRSQAVEENQRLRDRYGIVGDNYDLDYLKKFHDGGIVGESKTSKLTQLTNKLFNVKPGEQVVKSLVGELQIPPNNIPNLFTNLNSMLGSITPKTNQLSPAIENHYHFKDLTIKSDSPSDFIRDLKFIVSSR